jgi:uncharacterized protein
MRSDIRCAFAFMKPNEFSFQGKFDAARFCENESVWSGSLGGSELSRVAQAGHIEAPFVAAIRGDVGAYGKLHLVVNVNGSVTLECQRCLKDYKEFIDQTSSLWIAKNEREAVEIEAFCDQDDDVILSSEIENALQLFEDEILLAIPFAPQCGDAICAADA